MSPVLYGPAQIAFGGHWNAVVKVKGPVQELESPGAQIAFI